MVSYRTHQSITAVLRVLLAVGIAYTAPALAAGSLTAINFDAGSSGRGQIVLEFDQPVAEYNQFEMDNPPRIVLDLLDTKSTIEQRDIAVNAGIVSTINVLQAQARTRVIVNMSQTTNHEVRVRENTLYLLLQEQGEETASQVVESPGGGTVFSGGGANTIENIDFRRGEEGEARISIKLSNRNVIADIDERGNTIIMNFTNTTLPEELERRLDVIDFSTPITTIDSTTQEQGSRIVVTANGTYEHLAYQVGDTYVIEVRAIDPEDAEEKLREKLGYTGEKLSLNFQNIEVRAVLQLLADFTGLNIVASDTVTGSITLRLKNVPWDQALDIVLKTRGLGLRKDGDVVRIAPNEELAAQEQKELESLRQKEELAPLKTEFIEVNYASAKDIATMLSTKENTILSTRGSIVVDERTNTLMVSDTIDKLSDLRAIIGRLDIPVRQVLIESRIVTANDNFSRNLGVRAGVSGVRGYGDSGVVSFTGSGAGADSLIGDARTAITGGSNVNLTSVNQSDRLNVNLASGAPVLGLAILDGDYLVDLELSAMQSENQGEIISNPRVVTANQQEASIEQGVDLPYITADDSGNPTTEFKKAVLSLKVKPQITPDDRVIMDLEVNRDAPGASTPGGIGIDTRSVKTQVLVQDGDTVVLGGIYEQTKTETVNKVPFLGDIPLLGLLFRSKVNGDSKRELLIFVTPRIIREGISTELL